MKFIVNLNGTILCPYQLLLDILEQIPNNFSKIKELAFTPICDLNSTNDWINLESLGKPVAIRAKTIADTISALLKKQNDTLLELDIHLSNHSLSSDNLFSLLYLAESFSSLALTFFAEEHQWSDLQLSTQSLLSNECVSISFSSNASETNTAILTHLKAAREQSIKELGFNFDGLFVDKHHIPELIIKQLIGYSWLCLKSGGYDIACDLLEQAKSCTGITLELQEQLFMHLLMIRFFSHQYALIAGSDFPTQLSTLEPAEIRTLHFLTAYSATLTRNLDVARRFFQECDINENMPLTDEQSLYQLNLFALFKVLNGETDTAFDLEFRIKAFIEEHHIDTVGLKYVNFINIARLYKKANNYVASFDYYNKAYNQISGGGYTTSDHIYYNMNLGSLEEAAGNNEQTLLYWIKAATHWLACKNKYELSWRPRLILCQEKLSEVTKPLPIKKAHLFLYNKIKQLLQASQITDAEQLQINYSFVEDSSDINKERCFIKKNMILYTTNSLVTELKQPLEELQLTHLVSGYLHATLGVSKQKQVLIVDTHADTQLLNTQAEAAAFADFFNCTSCVFNGKLIQLDTTPKPAQATLSNVIDSITPTEKGLVITYKRSFLNKTLLEGNEINWVNQLQEQSPLSLHDLTQHDWNTIRQLAKKRVLNCSYS